MLNTINSTYERSMNKYGARTLFREGSNLKIMANCTDYLDVSRYSFHHILYDINTQYLRTVNEQIHD